ncbi:MAG: ABC transporter permease, partial [Solirubrobacteraceae bacterium]|nr:ABC transporter permease [Solirubrobacteraceae bacterium]
MSSPTLLAGGAIADRGPKTIHRVPALVRHSLLLAQRSLVKTMRTPEALIDVTIQPAIFLVLFTYVFGGAISGGSQQDYLQFLLPGILGQTIALGGVAIGVNLSEDVGKGVFDR